MTSEHGYGIEVEQSFRERLLDFRTMAPSLRILAGIVVAQTAATSLLLLLHEPWMPLTVYLDDPLVGTATISLADYVVSCAFLLIGLALFLRGLFEADHRGVIALLAILGTTYFLAVLALRPSLGLGITLLTDLLIAAVLGGVALGFWYVTWSLAALIHRRQPTLERQMTGADWLRIGIILLLILLLLVPVLVFYGFALTAAPSHFLQLLILLRTPLVTLFLIAAVDWAELTDIFARFAAKDLHLFEQDQRLIIATVIAQALALGAAGYTAYQVGWDNFFACVFLSMMIVATLWGVLRVSGFRGHWPTQFPWAALVLVVGGYNILFWVLMRYEIVGTVDFAILFTFLMSALLCVCGRLPKLIFLAPTMLFAVLLGLAKTLWEWIGPTYVVIGLNGTLAAFDIGMAALLVLAWATIKRAGIGDLRELLGLLLILNISLFAIHSLSWLYYAALRSSELFLVESLVVAVAILGEILLSGHNVTNIESAWFSRRSRVLLFFSFVTITLATVLSSAPVTGQNENLKEIQKLMNPEFSVWLGVIVIAPAMLWALFILRLGRWLAAKRRATRIQQPAAGQSI
jgi:hypothetical protein